MITRPREMICGGRGGEGSVRGEEGGLDEVDEVFVLLTPKQSTEESEWSNNGQLAILVPGQIIHTPLKQREEGGVRGRGGLTTI